METYVKRGVDSFTIKGVEYQIESDYRYSLETDEIVFDEELDNIAINKAYDLYRAEHHLITSEEIIAIRKKYNLSQRAFAALTGLGKATLARYELGAIPSQANSNFIKLLDNPSQMQALYSKESGHLSQNERDKFESAFNQLEPQHSSASTNDLVELILHRSAQEDLSDLNGYQSFDFSRMSQVIQYFIRHNEYLSRTKLNKLLFYSDFLAFKCYTQSITGSSYIHDHYGPVPSEQALIYEALIELRILESIPMPNSQGEYLQLVDGDQYQCDLPEDQLKILEIVDKGFKSDNAQTIMAKSHQKTAYTQTQLKEKISYNYADELEAINLDNKIRTEQ